MNIEWCPMPKFNQLLSNVNSTWKYNSKSLQMNIEWCSMPKLNQLFFNITLTWITAPNHCRSTFNEVQFLNSINFSSTSSYFQILNFSTSQCSCTRTIISLIPTINLKEVLVRLWGEDMEALLHQDIQRIILVSTTHYLNYCSLWIYQVLLMHRIMCFLNIIIVNYMSLQTVGSKDINNRPGYWVTPNFTQM